MACSEDVDLPCTAPWDPQVPYTVSWVKVGAAMPAGWGLVDSFEGSGNHLPEAGDPLWLPGGGGGRLPQLILEYPVSRRASPALSASRYRADLGFALRRPQSPSCP